MKFNAYIVIMKKLDLHRTRHLNVKRKVIHFIEDNWGSDEEVEIVTGNSDSMRDLVIVVLDEYKLSYEIGQPFSCNKNCLMVLME